MRICTKCLLPKSEKEMYPKRTYCRQCFRVVANKWEEKHKEWRKSYQKCYNKQYWLDKQDTLRPKKAKYYETQYRVRHNARRKERTKTDPEYRIKNCLRSRICYFVTGKTKSAKTMELLGCTLETLRNHLEKQFRPGMTWNNYGRRGWHMDHIQPCTAFDLTDPIQQRQCFHYTNLQPLWWKENISKGGA